MILRNLLLPAEADAAPAAADVEITGLAYRSGDVEPGALFFCVPGFTQDGHEFAADAVARGAAALVCERPLGLGVPEVIVESTRAAMAPIAARFYGEPTAQLRVVGVTGTNGKTTTTFLVRHILERHGLRIGMLGTVHSIVGGRREDVERTTPEALDLQRTFRRMLDAGDEVCVMEVSSHALDLRRADAIHFDCALFTNLTQDHLDFHGTLEEYFGAKRTLFVPQGANRPEAAVVNVDDSWGAELAGELAQSGGLQPVTFAVEGDADFRALEVRSSALGSTFTCAGPEGTAAVTMRLPGLFNVYNALGALAAATTLGVDLASAAESLSDAQRVPGRFEPVDEGQDFGVLVDYAHTPDSLANVLRAGRELLEQDPGRGRLVCVFGAGGDRDREKRPLMGEVARSVADHVVVTSDNPRSEDPGAIIAEIVAGAEGSAGTGERSTLEIEPDRRAAIQRALAQARSGDLVVIAGKGHEQGQELAGGRKVPFDDREVARDALRARRGRSAA